MMRIWFNQKKFRSMKGRVILPGAPGYDKARRVFNGRFDKHPAMIVRCADTSDVARAIEFARRNSLEVSVRSGGHDHAGYSAGGAGMVIDLTPMSAIKVDRSRGLASVEPGLRVGSLYHRLWRHRLTATSGTCPTVGIGGLTLGGGEGNLLCSHGLACDNVLSAQVVTADGSILAANSAQEPELFWGIRGGGGNFGVVTRIEMRAFAISRLLRGELVYASARCRDVFRFYRDFVASAENELSSGLVLHTSEEGTSLSIWFCYAGALRQGSRSVQPLLTSAEPLHVSVRSMTPPAALVEDAGPSGVCSLATGGFLPELSDGVIELIEAAIRAAPPEAEIGINDFRGAALTGDSAFPWRNRGFDAWLEADWSATHARDAAVAWLNQTWHALAPFTNGVYVNRLHEEGEDRTRAAYGHSYARLAAIKAKYDPTNFFHMNQNILPAV
jgi:hypothetical protein